MRPIASSLLIALLVALAAPVAVGTAGSIQPGDMMTTSVGQCTLSFVFDGVGALAGRVFFSTAAHCVSSVGQNVDSPPYDDFGTVAIIGDANALSTTVDYAFIEVKPAFEGLVVPNLKGHPQYPTQVARAADTTIGDPIQLSGYGLGFQSTTPTQEQRVGALIENNGERQQIAGPVIFGDSGGPIVHIPTGGALGLHSRLCGGACSEVGPSIEGVLAKAAARGFTVELRTV